MDTVTCDVCREIIEKAAPGRELFPIADYDLCEDCRDDLNRAIKKTMRGKSPFDYSWYDELQLKMISDGIQKGKIPV